MRLPMLLEYVGLYRGQIFSDDVVRTWNAWQHVCVFGFFANRCHFSDVSVARDKRQKFRRNHGITQAMM